jgi:hypothetical protein
MLKIFLKGAKVRNFRVLEMSRQLVHAVKNKLTTVNAVDV